MIDIQYCHYDQENEYIHHPQSFLMPFCNFFYVAF